MNFKEYKERTIWKLNHNDKSNEGKIDDAIKDLCDTINSFENYCTLSSCAGRISVLYDSEKKRRSIWLFKTHNEITNNQFRVIIEQLKTIDATCWLRMEPFILHVASNTLDNALKLLKIAQESGVKHSGIISTNQTKTVIEFISVERLDMIISHNKKIMITDTDIVIQKLNALLRKTRYRLNQFYQNILKNKALLNS